MPKYSIKNRDGKVVRHETTEGDIAPMLYQGESAHLTGAEKAAEPEPVKAAPAAAPAAKAVARK